MMARPIGIQCAQSPNKTVISTPTPTTPMRMPATPESELELGKQILSGLTTFSSGRVAWHAYWTSLFAAGCVIVCLAVAAKVTDQVAEHVVNCPAQAGFVDQSEASDCHGDERDGSGGEHESVSGWGNETGKRSRRPAETFAAKAACWSGMAVAHLCGSGQRPEASSGHCKQLENGHFVPFWGDKSLLRHLAGRWKRYRRRARLGDKPTSENASSGHVQSAGEALAM